MYQPEISDENVRRLFYLKCEKKKPMTVLLDKILKEYFEGQEREKEGQK